MLHYFVFCSCKLHYCLCVCVSEKKQVSTVNISSSRRHARLQWLTPVLVPCVKVNLIWNRKFSSKKWKQLFYQYLQNTGSSNVKLNLPTGKLDPAIILVGPECYPWLTLAKTTSTMVDARRQNVQTIVFSLFSVKVWKIYGDVLNVNQSLTISTRRSNHCQYAGHLWILFNPSHWRMTRLWFSHFAFEHQQQLMWFSPKVDLSNRRQEV